MPGAVVAIGGNALEPSAGHDPGGPLRKAVAEVVRLARLGPVVVTHGNGPQVGRFLAADRRLGLPEATALTQASIGSRLAALLRDEGVEAACLVTHVLVEDPAGLPATKPVGPILTRPASPSVRPLAKVPGGWREAVPSPRPTRVLDLVAIETLLGRGLVVIAAGGGGIPCVARAGRTVEVEGVVDKDSTAALLARDLGADLLLILTDVPGVHLDYDKPGQRRLERLRLDEAQRHLDDGQFPPGSMGPKVQAAIGFLRSRPQAQVRIALLDDPTQGTLLTS